MSTNPPRPAAARPGLHFAAALAVLFVVWRMDRLTTAQASMSIFYLIPIAYAAWFCGRGWAYAASILSAAAWLEADLLVPRHYAHWLIPYWNALVRLGFFVIVGSLTSVILRLRDVNARERDAERRAQEASALKSEMLSFVSHEFNNSLTTLKLLSTLFKESESGAAAASRPQLCEMLDRVIAHLSAAVSNFLNLSRLESGRFVPDFRRTPIRSLVHGVLSVLEPLIEAKDVELKTDFPSHPVPVRADPDAIELVMSNLIGNAYKYTPVGGVVTIRIVPEGEPVASVLICVEDTGIGISPEDQKRLTSGYFRGESGKRAAKGFGVGLTVVSRLLEAQGATLALESEPGKGSRFSFRLPSWRSA